MGMKYPEYDSPFELVMSNITTQMARNIDEMCWQAVQRVGVNVNKDTLLLALEYDSARYREAFRRGEETGYTKRDEEIVLCKDCIHRGKSEKCVLAAISEEKNFPLLMLDNRGEWFCADGKKEGR